MDNYQRYIHLSRYARFRDDLGRRETWEETVDRYISFFGEKYDDGGPLDKALHECKEAIINLEIMPSMRCLMTAGPALDRDNVAGYNCSFVAVEDQRVFDEIMYVLLCGTGVGFSVERQFINYLPTIAETFHQTDTTIVVPDSKIGWASSYRELISLCYSGKIPKWDLSRLRPAGARLKTFGGRASGPQPLDDLFRFTVEVFQGAAGRRLTSLECHDLVCKIADVVVVGGVRRSALLSLSNLTDERMRTAKSGAFWENNPQRALANNSVCYTEKPDIGIFLKEWTSLYESKTGERGIFVRPAAVSQSERNGRRDSDYAFGTNPCSEIILRSKQFCNLSEVVVRSDDTLESLRRKVRLATILGTLQSTLTDFRYLSKAWQHNTEEERLLGVSLTGIMDNKITSNRDGRTNLPHFLNELKNEAIETNKKWAKILGINQSTAITCVKPSGTVSQLVDSASGIHSRHSHYYIRTVRADKKDPLAQWMVEKRFPVEDDLVKPEHNYVFSFPISAPKTAVFRDDMGAVAQLELWKIYQDYWCEHKPSVTITVRENEWLDVGAWVYKHFDVCSGVSFLPHTEHVYKQAPYQECSKEQYTELLKSMPEVDFSAFKEAEDSTTGLQELSCVSGACEVV
jgi:ribonucleoside-diphosphate reductase alpha chain